MRDSPVKFSTLDVANGSLVVFGPSDVWAPAMGIGTLNSGQGRHALDGTRTPDVEDFEDKLAIVMDGCRIDDRREAEHIVLEQRLDQAQARQRRVGGSLFS